ncbi:MAG: carbon monoxide dehydrogenase [Nitrospinota bacterium]|nr:MAG: carbon monoxide dehydrogenase [Nitrospinota bacterium]
MRVTDRLPIARHYACQRRVSSMQVQGSYRIPAPPQQVWEAFTDPHFVRQCLPGCQSFAPLGNDTYQATLEVGIASIKGVYTGRVAMEDKRPPFAYRLVVEGRSQLGFVKGIGDLTLQETAEKETEILVHGEVQVGGRIARVGQRILGSAAKMMMDRFFQKAIRLITAS